MKLPHQHPYALDTPWSAGVVLLGAGQGERLGHGPKALVDLGGKPILLHTLEAMASNETVTTIVVTAPDGMRDTFERIIASAVPAVPVRVVPGGPTRQASAHAGVTALPGHVQWAAVTDVARPFTPHGTVDQLLDVVRGAAERSADGPRPCGAVPVLPLVDSVHLAGEVPSLLAGAFDRGLLRAAQTPQVFHRACLTAAYAAAIDEGVTHTDEAGLVGGTGATVVTAPGSPANFKITVAHDLMMARAVHAHAESILQGHGSMA
ncbi:IspD/TarI family cytidylyltransferase [Streptomyces sp. NPDC054841]